MRIVRRIWELEPDWFIVFNYDGDGVRINVYDSHDEFVGLIVNEMESEELSEETCREFLTTHITDSHSAVAYTMMTPHRFKTIPQITPD
jgi:hypothetical protein